MVNSNDTDATLSLPFWVVQTLSVTTVTHSLVSVTTTVCSPEFHTFVTSSQSHDCSPVQPNDSLSSQCLGECPPHATSLEPSLCLHLGLDGVKWVPN